MGRKKKYFTEEEKKAAQREYEKQWRKRNPEKAKEIDKRKCNKYAENHPNKLKEIVKKSHKKYRNTPIGRANTLISNYAFADKMYNRGECTLTAQWVVDNIFSKPCAHCGITGWEIIGCNRLNNSLPHTPDNVEPCCFNCNIQLEERKRDIKGKFIKTNEVLVN